MSNEVRLIDANKLIKTLRELEWITDNPCDGDNVLEDIIDNAPTVEPFEPDYVGAERLKARQRGYEEGYHRGMKIGKTLNPKIKQGEWIFGSTLGHGWMKCSNCCVSQSGQTSCWSYCPNCGADMRGGVDNEKAN